MTDEQIVSVVANIFRRAQAGEFGRVGGLKPAIHIKLNPFATTIGELYLSKTRTLAVADGTLKIEGRALGWAVVGNKETKGPIKQSLRRYFDAQRFNRKPAGHQTAEERRAEYLREVGREEKRA